MLNIENLWKSYGGNELFRGVSFQVNSGERIGVVGRNGQGKTTLFRLITGETEADSGTVTVPKQYRIGHVTQTIAFRASSVLAEGIEGLTPAEADQHWKVEKVLAGLGFTSRDMQRHPSEFSGGYQVRLNLAKVLVSEPDLLLLDEPTNYLDIASIRWIVKFLAAWPRQLMLITHDRGFMDQVVTHVLGIHRRKLRKIAGTTDQYYTQLAQEEEIYEKTRINDEKRRREVELFISRFRAKARLANLVQSRIKTLNKTDRREKLEKLKTLDFSFRRKPFSGKRMMTVEDIAFGYDRLKPVIADFSVTIARGDRIGVIGRNGRGKTTLLKLLAGMLQPQRGRIQDQPGVVKGVFEQSNTQILNPENSVLQEILLTQADVDQQLARNICGAMLFSGEEALKKIAVLSGGEKSRVMLGKLLTLPVNMLLLDEPTNHLDMEACDALLSAIDDFAGTVVMVTHNEMFLHALAERLVVFQGGGIEVFEGDYARFLEEGGWIDEGTEASATTRHGGARPAERPNKKTLRRLRSEVVMEKTQALKPLEKQVAAVEKQINEKELELSRLTEAMQQAAETHDGQRIAAISQQLHACRNAVDAHYDALDALTRELEKKQAAFDARLESLQETGLDR